MFYVGDPDNDSAIFNPVVEASGQTADKQTDRHYHRDILPELVITVYREALSVLLTPPCC